MSLQDHLQTGSTTICRCWAITRRDGHLMGFTDHDLPLEFEGITFSAQTGLTASAFQQTTGLSVDNTEAIGALSDSALREEDIEAGRYDGAEVRSWLVNWANIADRKLIFRGVIGELRRSAGRFEAELHGLSQALNRPLGRAYQKPCTAVLGDAACQFNRDTFGYWQGRAALAVTDRRVFRFDGMEGYAPDWFRYGRLLVLSGKAEGGTGLIREDRQEEGQRVIELWQPLRAPVAPGDMIRLEAGCDKRMVTCQGKFDNLLNFQGFPDIPGDDLLSANGVSERRLDGGSRRA